MDSFYEILRSVLDEWGSSEEVDRWIPTTSITSGWEEIGRTDDFIAPSLWMEGQCES